MPLGYFVMWFVVKFVPPLSMRAVLLTYILVPLWLYGLACVYDYRYHEILGSARATVENLLFVWENSTIASSESAVERILHYVWVDVHARICLSLIALWVACHAVAVLIFGRPTRMFSSPFINGQLLAHVLFFCAVLLLSEYIFDRPIENRFIDEFQDSSKFSGKTIVITGANAGLGFHTAKWLAEWGEAKTIYLGTRSKKKCEDAQQEIYRPAMTKLKCFHFDLHESVQELDREVERTVNKMKVDVLINNAGFLLADDGSADQLEKHTKDVYSAPHFLMFTTHNRLKRRLKAYNSDLQVVTVSSIGAYECAFHGIDKPQWDGESEQWLSGADRLHPLISAKGLIISLRRKYQLKFRTPAGPVRDAVYRALDHNLGNPVCSTKLDNLHTGTGYPDYLRVKFWQVLGADKDYETAVYMGYVQTNIFRQQATLRAFSTRNGRIGAIPIVKAALKRLEILDGVERRVRMQKDNVWGSYLENHSCITQQGTFISCFDNIYFRRAFDREVERRNLHQTELELLDRAGASGREKRTSSPAKLPSSQSSNKSSDDKDSEARNLEEEL